jgi:hypothetical protein
MNKIDLATQNPPRSRQCVEIETSATLGTGMDSLRRAIIAMLIPDVPRAGSPVPICDRQIRALNDILAANDVTSLGQSAKQLLGR